MFRALASAFRRHGPLRFCYLVVYNAVYYLARRDRNEQPDPMDVAFDEGHGVETAKIREIGSLDIPSPNAKYAVRYQASDKDLARDALARLELDWPGYTFIDYGCGKGLVLLLASAYPYKQIVGVEFAIELQQIAARNIASYAAPEQQCRSISVVPGDAADFVPPPGPLVCYFYNPFGEPVMRKIVERLETRATENNEPIVVVYIDPRHEALFRKSDRWENSFRNEAYVIFCARIQPRQ